jgi:uridine phosphorylase
VSLTILVPRGAEERAVRHAAPHATIVALAAGAASAALPAAIDGAACVVLVGLCGSLGAARVGDVVVYTAIVDPEGASEVLDPASCARVGAALPHARRVVAAMSDHVVTKAIDRAALATRSHADVVDMEALHVARALRARGLACAMVRVVSDDPAADLPSIENVLAPSGAIRPLELARAFASAPLAFTRFVRNVQASLRVLSATAASLDAAVK